MHVPIFVVQRFDFHVVIRQESFVETKLRRFSRSFGEDVFFGILEEHQVWKLRRLWIPREIWNRSTSIRGSVLEVDGSPILYEIRQPIRHMARAALIRNYVFFF